jgi:hypothetical protein
MNKIISRKQIITLIILIAIVLVVGVLIPAPKKIVESPVESGPYQVTVVGTVVCAPPVDPSVPSTRECRYAIQTPDGKYYLVTMANDEMGFTKPTGTKVLIQGLYVPKEQLNTDQWQKYNMEGIISVDTVTETQ